MMGLYTEAAITHHAGAATSRTKLKWARGGVAELIEAGLVQPGDELVWDRRYANPSGGTDRPWRQTQQRMAVLEAPFGRAHLG
jgi:hypothetical protein